MRIIDPTASSGFARKTARSASDFAIVVHNLIMDVRDSYRPELHYMRGPGPKWRAKHQPWLKFDSQALLPTGQVRAVSLHRAPGIRIGCCEQIARSLDSTLASRSVINSSRPTRDYNRSIQENRK